MDIEEFNIFKAMVESGETPLWSNHRVKQLVKEIERLQAIEEIVYKYTRPSNTMTSAQLLETVFKFCGLRPVK